MKERLLTIIALVVATVFVLSVFSLTFQSIGVDSANKATIIGGILGMFGGIVGAFSAYLIARLQLTKQLELHDEKEKNRVLLEIRLRKTEEILDVLNRTKKEYFILQGSWFSAWREHTYYALEHLEGEIDYKKFIINDLLDTVSKNRDMFVNTYLECYKYRPYHKELIDDFEKIHNELFKPMTVNINEIAFHFIGVNGNHRNYKDIINSITGLSEEVANQFLEVLEEIDRQIKVTEVKVNELLKAFQNKEL